MSSGIAQVSEVRFRPRLKPSWRKLGQILGTLFTIMAVVGWIFVLRPQGLGGPASYVMVSGQSMEPTYESGDFVVALERDSYGVGDVIVYRVPEGDLGAGRLIIHRVIDGDQVSGFRTQGDNRPTPDEWKPTEEDIVGKLWFHIPNAGSLLPYLRSPIALASFFGVFTFLLVFLDRDKKDEAAEPVLEANELEDSAAGSATLPAPVRSSRRSWVRPALFTVLGIGALVAGFLSGSRRKG